MQHMRGKYFEELEEGQVFWSSGRTVTDGDISDFAHLSGDYNPLHMDEHYVKAHSVFPRRTPHGPLGLVFSLGMYDRIGLLEGTAMAFLDLDWKFLKPVLVGDTLHAKVVVARKKETSKPDRGVLTLHIEMHNQKNEVVQEGDHSFMIRRKPTS